MIHNDYLDAISLANSYPPLLLDDYNRLEQAISREYRWYIIGLTCSLAKIKGFKSDTLNNSLTRVQIAQNSGYKVETMKRFICYANSINRLQEILPYLATEILAGRTKLGLKTTIILAKLSQNDISVIMKRVETENTPIRKIISEQVKRPLTYPRRFSDGRSTKNSPKSIKDTPQYDPDAQIAGLLHTIPSWVKAIERIHTNDNLLEVSKPARNNLNTELSNLKSVIEVLIELIMEVSQ